MQIADSFDMYELTEEEMIQVDGGSFLIGMGCFAVGFVVGYAMGWTFETSRQNAYNSTRLNYE